ncbi:hypothetical protein QR680_000085 [Steinernema hermaphroditum]|uniref:S-adenosylmethionine-dependent methyltransferase Rv2258c-like winged HTH domain-containing protein n=1 Tax=Steinernema hermaphroditum TaxID=289476 RepID=A0AA39LDH9_9BILA|nr:hypothetical protein QR680_000085 [Steinernema hermaphroditum]
MNVTTNGMLCLVIALGKELKIFETLGEISSKENPVLAEAIAEKAGLKERYVREWLASMACAHFVDVTDDGERFWIANEKKAVLCCDHEALEMLVFTQQFVPIYKTMIDVFRIDGPKGTTYDQYSDIITRLNIVPLIEVQECALNNLEMLDVGCGNGDIVNI